ncbi:MAG: hypothetical protein HUU21_39820 [Polyangiaceae bacterium]|nr:hypothetical protein [Polyangiaceae bacterium]
MPSENTVAQFPEEAGRQHPMIVSAGLPRDRPQIKSGPGETIQFVETKPMPTAVQAEAATRRCGISIDAAGSSGGPYVMGATIV